MEKKIKMKSSTHNCKQNDAVVKVWFNDNGIQEFWIKIKGENSYIVVGYADFQRAITKAERKNKLKDSHSFGGGYIDEALMNLD